MTVADPSATASLALRDIDVHFDGLTALDGVSLEAQHGRVLGVIGPNGAGKTTLFNVICGFVRPDRGEILWQGEPLRRHSPQRLAGLRIARTLQGLGLFPGLTVVENVMVGADHLVRSGFTAALLGLPRADRAERDLRARATRVLERLDIAEHAQRLPTALPFALQKRVALARALVASPSMLLLDEPAGGLGTADITELGALIRELRGEMAVVLVEHHMDLVMDVCDDVVVLDFGRVIAHGPPEEIRNDAGVMEAYLGSDDNGGGDDAQD